jgi:hypothetical protein
MMLAEALERMALQHCITFKPGIASKNDFIGGPMEELLVPARI